MGGLFHVPGAKSTEFIRIDGRPGSGVPSKQIQANPSRGEGGERGTGNGVRITLDHAGSRWITLDHTGSHLRATLDTGSRLRLLSLD